MITLSPPEIIALLIEVDGNTVPTDALYSARHKLEAEYRRIVGTDPVLHIFRNEQEREEEMAAHQITEYQSSLIDGYYALDPDARILGYFKGQPVVQAHTSPIALRGPTTRRNIVVIAREGATKRLPQNWADTFIPAEGTTWAEAEIAIEDWIMHYQQSLLRNE